MVVCRNVSLAFIRASTKFLKSITIETIESGGAFYGSILMTFCVCAIYLLLSIYLTTTTKNRIE
jgi:hypothetical protein